MYNPQPPTKTCNPVGKVSVDQYRCNINFCRRFYLQSSRRYKCISMSTCKHCQRDCRSSFGCPPWNGPIVSSWHWTRLCLSCNKSLVEVKPLYIYEPAKIPTCFASAVSKHFLSDLINLAILPETSQRRYQRVAVLHHRNSSQQYLYKCSFGSNSIVSLYEQI